MYAPTQVHAQIPYHHHQQQYPYYNPTQNTFEDYTRYNSSYGQQRCAPVFYNEQPNVQNGIQNNLQASTECSNDNPISKHLMSVTADFIADLSCEILNAPKTLSPTFTSKLVNVLNATRLPTSTIILALTYLYRRKQIAILKNSNDELQFNLNDEHKLYVYVIVSMILANKFNDDNTFTNRSWSNATGLDVSELNLYERDWLMRNNYDLHFGPANSNYTDFQQLTGNEPWLLDLARLNPMFFNPFLNLQTDPIYSSKDEFKKYLKNGELDYMAIESAFRTYQIHGSLVPNSVNSNSTTSAIRSPLMFDDPSYQPISVPASTRYDSGIFMNNVSNNYRSFNTPNYTYQPQQKLSYEYPILESRTNPFYYSYGTNGYQSMNDYNQQSVKYNTNNTYNKTNHINRFAQSYTAPMASTFDYFSSGATNTLGTKNYRPFTFFA